ncbi:MAG: glycoside hydrolase family 19 protein [Rhodospirillaceae bacterium]
MIDRDVFFARVREAPFGGVMRQGQVDGCNAILDAWEARAGFVDRRWLAYMLATAKWETAHTMKPIEEIGKGHGHPYGVPTVDGRVFYGRGYVQLTWATNYAKMAALTGTDLVGYPDLALDPEIAAIILLEGMKGGMFTGAGLPRYFNDAVDDAVNARRIINGSDHAADIAAIHAGFLAGLS